MYLGLLGFGDLALHMTQGHLVIHAAIQLITLLLCVEGVKLARLKCNTYNIKPMGEEV